MQGGRRVGVNGLVRLVSGCKNSGGNGHHKSVSTLEWRFLHFLQYPADGDGGGGLLGELGAASRSATRSHRLTASRQ